MTAPKTYAEWLPLFDRFKAGDDSVLACMHQGSIEWTNVVAERWTKHVADSLTTRLQTLSKQFQTALDRTRGDYYALSNAMLQARRSVGLLSVFVNLPAMPEDVRYHLVSELNRWAAETQRSLERHAEGIRHDQGRLLKTIRDHALTVMPAVPSPQDARRDEDENVPPVFRGRRVIL